MAIIQNNISFTNVNNIGKGTSISNIKKGSVDDMIADASELYSLILADKNVGFSKSQRNTVCYKH